VSTGTLNALLIDDNRGDRLLARRLLEREFPGIVVREIVDAAGFAAALDEDDFGAAIVDYSLGWSDGLEVFKALRARRPHLPVVMFTGTATQEVIIEAMKAGLDDYVIKQPRHLLRLPPALRAALERAEARREKDRLERDGERLLSQLRESESRYRLLVEWATDFAMFLVSPDGRITSWNAGAVRLFGWSEREAIGRPLSFIFTPEDVEAGVPEKELAEADRTGAGADERWHVRKDGSRFWCSGSVRPVKEADRLVGFAKVMRDLTERKRAEEEREELLAREREARARAEAADRSKDEFLAMVSHELRNPLNSMLGWTRLLRSGALAPEEVAGALEAVERAASDQNRLIRDILDLSRIVNGKMVLETGPVDLAAVVRAALDSVRFAADAKGVRLRADLDPEAAPTTGDAGRLQQAVWNLLSNAVKFTPEGGLVEVRLERCGSESCVIVRDTGGGIRPEFLPHVFERFRQADARSARTHKGLGLGLAIAKEIVELHGGTVRAASEGEGRGAEFTVRLPVRAVRAERVPAMPTLPRDRGGPRPPRRLDGVRVLVVDDEADARSLGARVLGRAGAEVATAGSVREAMERMTGQPPDVLLSDIGMPDEDGYDLIRRVRALPPGAGGLTPAAGLTAFASESDRRRTREAGFQLHLSKPVEPGLLVEAVAELTNRPETPS
jgi:PAS domain S-box-containing protein